MKSNKQVKAMIVNYWDREASTMQGIKRLANSSKRCSILCSVGKHLDNLLGTGDYNANNECTVSIKANHGGE